MKQHIYKTASFIAGMFMCITSLLALISYLADEKKGALITWGGETPISLPAAVMFVTTGVMFIFAGIIEENHKKHG